MYDLGDRLLMVASDRISAYDVVLPTPIPDKGKVLTGLSVFWFEQTARHRPEPPDLDRRARRGPRPRAGGARSSTSSRSSAWPRGTCPARDGRSTGGRAPCAGSSCRPGCGSPTACPSRSSRRRRRPSWGSTTRTSTSIAPRRSSATARSMEELRRLTLELYRFAAGHAERNGIILADTKFEFGRDADGRIVLADEVLTPGLVPLLARGPLRARPLSALLRQAVRARLARRVRLGPHPARPGAARRGRGRHPRQVRRGLRTDLGRPFGDWLAR